MKQSTFIRPLFVFCMSLVLVFSTFLPHHAHAQFEYSDPFGATVGNYDEESTAEFRRKCVAVAKNVATYATAALGVLADGAYSCVKEVFKGAWSSTGAGFEAGVKTAGSTIGNTAGCMVTGGFSQCGKDLVDKVRSTAAYVTDLVSNLKSSFPNLSSQQIVDLTCNVLGMMGPYALLTIATGGAAAGGLALGVARVVSVLQKIAALGPINIFLKTLNLPMELLTQFGSNTLERVMNLFKKDPSKGPQIREALMACGI